MSELLFVIFTVLISSFILLWNVLIAIVVLPTRVLSRVFAKLAIGDHRPIIKFFERHLL